MVPGKRRGDPGAVSDQGGAAFAGGLDAAQGSSCGERMLSRRDIPMREKRLAGSGRQVPHAAAQPTGNLVPCEQERA